MNTRVVIEKHILHLRALADELEMLLLNLDKTVVEMPLNKPNEHYCDCLNWSFVTKNCGWFKQVPPQFVLDCPEKNCTKYCPEIPF